MKNSQDLPILINDRVILPFREGFIFTKFREKKVLAKISEFTVYDGNEPIQEEELAVEKLEAAIERYYPQELLDSNF